MSTHASHEERRMAPDGRRVAVAMSGGVDSSVAAALLVEQGFSVVGVHMKLHDVPEAEKRNKSCCTLEDSLDARQVCARLGIPYYVIDLTAEFQALVIDYFVEAYRAGRTPNPCVMCNRTVKSDILLERVREFGCEALATGHYARVGPNPHTGAYEIRKPRDRNKDQTYFLHATPRAEMPHLLFPLADLEKTETRELAGRYGFITWDKPDSQEVCFVPRNYRDFLKPRLGQAPPRGEFTDRAGKVLGTHDGLPYYTIGQRRGLGVSAARPLYVVGMDAAKNQVVLGHEEALYEKAMTVSQVNWVSCPPIARPMEAEVKVRYAHAGTPARLIPAGEDKVRVEFSEPVRAIAPGQAAVFYAGEVLLGGGCIEAGL